MIRGMYEDSVNINSTRETKLNLFTELENQTKK